MPRPITLALLLLSLGACDGESSQPDAAPALPATKFVYLNFEGVTLEPGDVSASRNTTNIVTTPTTFPPFLAARPDREVILAGIAAETAAILAPYDIGVVRARPDERYMMIVFSTPSMPLGLGDGTAIGAVACAVADHASVISLQFEPPEIAAEPEILVHTYATQTVAEVGLAYGVPPVTTNGNCMCWNDEACFPDYGMERCVLGTAALDPVSQCRADDPVDVAGEFLRRLKPHP